MSGAKKTLKGKNCTKPREIDRVKSFQIRLFSGPSDGRLDLTRDGQWRSKLTLLKGIHQARVYSDQMFLMMARQ